MRSTRYGFAWTRRVNEDNVDLNRNFVDHDKAYPKNDGYLAIADAVLPQEWTDESKAASERTFASYAQKHGAYALQGAISSGQYTHPDGIFFGGARPTWSNRTIRAIAREELGRARRVGIIDFHTGLGPFGHGELICAVPPTAKSFPRAKAWYGDELTSPEGGTSTSAIVVGIMTDAFPQELPDAEVTPVAIEYGTYSVPEVLGAVRGRQLAAPSRRPRLAAGPRAQGRHEGALLPGRRQVARDGVVARRPDDRLGAQGPERGMSPG